MAKKTVLTYQHPLDWFLETDPDEYDNLTVLARRFAAEPFDQHAFRTDLVAKLKRLKYQPEDSTGGEKTFHNILSEAGVLGVLLEPTTLRELWKCLLLKKIAERDRELEEKKKAADELPLRLHRKKARQIWRDLGAIEKIAERYDARKDVEKLCEKLNREVMHHLKIELACGKYRVPPSVLLSGQLPDGVRYAARDEDLATQKAIYQVLKGKLQTEATQKKGVSGAFLCQLAELIWARPDVRDLTKGKNLYRALKRSPI